MTLEQLRIFVAVAEREHVTRAADALHLTQSAVSGALAALEAQHGVRLLDRVGRGVVLNELGKAFLIEARGVLSRAAAAETALDELAGLRRGRLAIHATPTIANYWLPRRLVAFRRAHQGVELTMTIADTETVIRAVRDGAADLGFSGAVKPAPDLVAEAVGTDRLVLLAPPDHPWIGREAIDKGELAAGPWVLREQGSGSRRSLEAALSTIGVEPAHLTVALTLGSNEAALAAVEAGAGVAALSQSVAEPALAAGRLARAPMDLPERSYFLIRHGQRYRSRASEAFLTSART